MIQLRAALLENRRRSCLRFLCAKDTRSNVHHCTSREERDSELSTDGATTLNATPQLSLLEELRELSRWLEQRCRLEDIFKKASDSSRMAKKCPLQNSSLPPFMNRSTKDMRSSVALSHSTAYTSSSVCSQQHSRAEMMWQSDLLQLGGEAKRNALRSRIREAQDAQYLM